ncbi:MAG TPA: STAS domain-containing protein [Pseudonocardiaceae bacterium]|nr:STAS domain-containing protein [Pseudonocardiaceae bacterium]
MNAQEPTRRWVKSPADQPGVCLSDAGSAAAIGDTLAGGFTPQRPWALSVQQYPAAGICAVVVEGELDLETAPLLEQCIRQQLLALPEHLILDLELLHFLGSGGLSCLLRARQLAHASAVQLHLAGLVTPAIGRTLQITGLMEVFHTYPSLLHAVIDLADKPDVRSPHEVPSPVLTVFWRCLVGGVWVVELCEFDGDAGHETVVDWINSGVAATEPVPDAAQQLLAAHGLWLFPDPVVGSSTSSRRRIGYACADAELIVLAHLMHGEATQVGLHPVMLAAWVAAGYSIKTAVGWIRAGCLLPR